MEPRLKLDTQLTQISHKFYVTTCFAFSLLMGFLRKAVNMQL